jgi:hypothetical protein
MALSKTERTTNCSPTHFPHYSYHVIMVPPTFEADSNNPQYPPPPHPPLPLEKYALIEGAYCSSNVF